MTFLAGFVVGLFIGALIGVLVVCLCVMASESAPHARPVTRLAIVPRTAEDSGAGRSLSQAIADADRDRATLVEFFRAPSLGQGM